MSVRFRAAAVAALLLPLTMAPAQKPALPDKPDPEVAGHLEDLLAAVKDRKQSRDAEAIAAIEALVTKQAAGMHPRDARKTAAALGKVFLLGRVRPPDKMELYRSAGVALGRFGAAGSKLLQRVYDSNRFPNRVEWVPLRVVLIESVGKTKDERAVKFLTDEASRSMHDAVIAAAGAALANFEQSDQRVRKQIVKELLKKYGELEAAVATNTINIPGRPQNFAGSNAKQTLAAIKPKWHATLRKLSGQKFTKFNDWQRWYNKNKSKSWGGSG